MIPELLAPASNFDCIEAACRQGADAVYIGGGTLNLRAHSRPFSPRDIASAVGIAHAFDKKLYIALNTMPGEDEIGIVEDFLSVLALNATLPDALIVSDPGVVLVCKEIVPTIPLHLSTQTGTANSKSIAFWHKQGINRFVLPRELTLEEIAVLSRIPGIETEVFIHGAMCMAISGRCLMSAYMNKRHPNKGDCAQPCRLRYKVTPIFENPRSQAPTEVYDGELEDSTTYLMNSKDLNTLAILPEIIASGVASLKIEGRNKSINYISSVVRIYRQAIDAARQDSQRYTVRDSWRVELDALDHRPYTTGFFKGEYELQALAASKAADSARMVGVVKASFGPHQYVIDIKNPFDAGEVLAVIPVQYGKDPFPTTVESIFDFNNHPLEHALTNRLAVISSSIGLREGDILRRA